MNTMITIISAISLPLLLLLLIMVLLLRWSTTWGEAKVFGPGVSAILEVFERLQLAVHCGVTQTPEPCQAVYDLGFRVWDLGFRNYCMVQGLR